MKAFRNTLLSLVVLIVGFYLTIHTTFFQKFLIQKIKTYTEKHHQISFVIDGIDSLLPFSLNVQSMRVIDLKNNQDILKVDGLKIRLETAGLLSGDVHLRYARIEKLHVCNLPTNETAAPTENTIQTTIKTILENHWGKTLSIKSFTIAPKILNLSEPFDIEFNSSALKKNLSIKGTTSQKDYFSFEIGGSLNKIKTTWSLNIPKDLGFDSFVPQKFNGSDFLLTGQLEISNPSSGVLVNGDVMAKSTHPFYEYELMMTSKTHGTENNIVINGKSQTPEATQIASATAVVSLYTDENIVEIKDAVVSHDALPSALNIALKLSKDFSGNGSLLMKDEQKTYVNLNATFTNETVDLSGCLSPLDSFPEILRTEFKNALEIKGGYRYKDAAGQLCVQSDNNHFLNLTFDLEKGVNVIGAYHSVGQHLFKKSNFTVYSDDLNTFLTKGNILIVGDNKIEWDTNFSSQKINAAKITVSLPDITDPSVLLGTPTVGDINGSLTLKNVDFETYKGDCDLKFESKQFRSIIKAADTLIVGKLIDGKGKITFQTENLKNKSKSFWIDKGKVTLDINLNKIHFDAEAASYKRGFLNSRLKFKSTGDVDLKTNDFTLSTFDLLHQTKHIVLQNPLHVKSGLCQKDVLISVDKGSITIKNFCIGSHTQDWSGKVVIQDVPLGVLHMVLPTLVLNGSLNGQFALSGRQHLEIAGDLKGEKITWSHLHEDHETIKKRTFEIYLKGKYAVNAVEWAINCLGQDQVDLKINGSLNTKNGCGINDASALNCTTSGWVNIGLISAILSSGDLMSGRLNLDLKANGTILNPGINGQIALQSAYVELADFGTVLNDIELQATARNSVFTIERGTTTDRTRHQSQNSELGQLNVSGLINVQNSSTPKINLTAILKHFLIANSDSVKGRGDGTITINSNTYNPDIKGEVHLDKVVINIDELSSDDDIPKISIDDPNARRHAKQREKEIIGETGVILPLHIRLIAGDKFSIIGKGLDCEWKGEMMVNGPIDDPHLLGRIDAKRGKFDFFGRTMKIESGEVIFTKDDLNEPKLKIISTREFDRGTITLTINSTAEKQLRFDSSPAMPEEEVISQLLFNKEAGRVSAGQSVQLAAAIAKINGQKGLNIMEKLRSNLGLDSFEFREQQHSNTSNDDPTTTQALSVGKEISDGVKISVEQGAGQGSSRISVDAEITPNLSISADASGYQGNGVGFNWTKRY